MKSQNVIQEKQIQWALNNGIKLIGSKGKRGKKAYVRNLKDNLFEPLLGNVKKDIADADGSELSGTADSPAKMQAVHSSSALCVNIFQYWLGRQKIPEIAAACGLCDTGSTGAEMLQFEQKFEISPKLPREPNIDIVINNGQKSRHACYAIESKFTEPFSKRKHGGIKPAYLALSEIWSDVPNLLKLAKALSPADDRYRFLHAAQLMKHILGLKQAYGKNRFRLLYLYYDGYGEESHIHNEEIKTFAEIVKKDGISFLSLTYQELIISLAEKYRSTDAEYMRYVTERYL